MDVRQERGLTIAKDKRIRRITEAIWMVPSQSHTGTYAVDIEASTCTCPDHETRACKCKHLWAVEYVRQRVTNADGTTEVSETLTLKRVTYPQKWPAYNGLCPTNPCRPTSLEPAQENKSSSKFCCRSASINPLGVTPDGRTA